MRMEQESRRGMTADAVRRADIARKENEDLRYELQEKEKQLKAKEKQTNETERDMGHLLLLSVLTWQRSDTGIRANNCFQW